MKGVDDLVDELDANRANQPWNIGWRYHEGQHQWRVNLWRHPSRATKWHKKLSGALLAAVMATRPTAALPDADMERETRNPT